jgi:hypothetical protein
VSAPAVATRRKVALGFAGGPTLAARIEDEALAALREALRRGAPWHELPVDDGVVVVSLDRLAYLHVETDEGRLGFG